MVFFSCFACWALSSVILTLIDRADLSPFLRRRRVTPEFLCNFVFITLNPTAHSQLFDASFVSEAVWNLYIYMWVLLTSNSSSISIACNILICDLWLIREVSSPIWSPAVAPPIGLSRSLFINLFNRFNDGEITGDRARSIMTPSDLTVPDIYSENLEVSTILAWAQQWRWWIFFYSVD